MLLTLFLPLGVMLAVLWAVLVIGKRSGFRDDDGSSEREAHAPSRGTLSPRE